MVRQCNIAFHTLHPDNILSEIIRFIFSEKYHVHISYLIKYKKLSSSNPLPHSEHERVH